MWKLGRESPDGTGEIRVRGTLNPMRQLHTSNLQA